MFFFNLAIGQLNQVDDSCSDKSINTASKIEQLEDQFDKLRTQIKHELSTQHNITVQILLDTLTSLPLSLKREYESSIARSIPVMRTETQIDELFIHLNPLLSFIDYNLVEFFIRKFGSDKLRKDMRSYCSEMKVFMKETTIQQLIDLFPGQTEVPPKFSLVQAKIGEDASKCTLEQINIIRKRYCSEVKLSEIVFHLVAIIDSNSFIIQWLVPQVLVSDIVKFNRQIKKKFFHKYKITTLTLDGMWLYMSEAAIGAMWLHVSDTKLNDQFHTIHKQIALELDIKEVSVKELSQFLVEQQPHLSEKTSIYLSHAFVKHRFPLSFVDSEMLKILNIIVGSDCLNMLDEIVERFGSDCLRNVMKSLCSFILSKNVQLDLQQITNKCPQMLKKAKFRLMKESSDNTQDNTKSSICAEINLNEFAFAMKDIRKLESGLLSICWLVSSSLVLDIIESLRNIDRSFYQEHKITSFTLDAIWLYLSESETDALWSRVLLTDTQFKNQFYAMYEQIVCELKMEKISERDLSSYLMVHQPRLQSNVSIVLSEAFKNRDFPLSLIDFRILIKMILRFGSDCLKRVMKSYCSHILIYVKPLTVQQLIELSPIQFKPSKYFVTAECRIMEEPSNYTLQRLLSFQTRFCTSVNISEICFVMGEINAERNSSFIVKWVVPSVIVANIVKSARNIKKSFYQEFKITFFTLDELYLYIIKSEIDALWSQVHVTDKQFKNQFCTMYEQIVRELEMEEISERSLSSCLMAHQPRLQSNVSIVLSEAFKKRDFPLSLVDYRILIIIIERFGSDCLWRMMKSYHNRMSIYTTVMQLVDLPPVLFNFSEYFVTAECRIMEEPSNYTLERLVNFQSRFCTSVHISEICFVMGEINVETEDAFIVKWVVPSAIVTNVVKSASNVEQSFCQEYRIASFTVNAMWLYISEPEIDAVWSQVHVTDTRFKDQFYTMYDQLVCELDIRKVSKHDLSLNLMDQTLKLQKNVSMQLSEMFLQQTLALSFIDFKILTIIVERFGSDCLKRVMKSYCNLMSVCIKQLTVQQLIDLSPLQLRVYEYFVIAECRIMEEPSKYTLERLLNFQTRFCTCVNINEICFVVGEINTSTHTGGSFIVKWAVPSAAAANIVISANNVEQNLYREYGITSFTLDAMWLYVSEPEIDAMWSQVHVTDTRFKNQFYTMYDQIVCELEIGKVSKHDLSLNLMDQPLNLQSNVSMQLSEMFLEQTLVLSLVDFKILTIIIERFGSNCLKRVMKSYCDHMSVYSKKLTVQQLIDLSPAQPKPSKDLDFLIAKCKIDKQPSDYGVDRLLVFCSRFCTIVNLNEICFIMDEISKEDCGLFTVSWLIPSSQVLDLLKSANQIKETELFQEASISSLQLGCGWMYHHQLLPFGTNLKKQYQQFHGSPSPVGWIPSPTMKIFRLAMIQRERVQRGHIGDRFVRMTISGRVDDILHAKSPVELENIFRNSLHSGEIILIEGAPGSGKSTLTVHVCQTWGKGELFQQFTVVILVQLRDPAVQRAQTIADLLPVDNFAIAHEVATELIATDGCGVLWILDGWDELPPQLQQHSIFRKLINGTLNRCSVVVTSRPVSSGDLHPVVSSRIEVLGFTPEEQMQYFIECLQGDTKALKALLEKIQENPVVQSICYLPLNAAFIVHTFKCKGQSLPNTEYEIYLSVILSCIQRHFEREGKDHDLPREVASFNDLYKSEAVREPFQCLCELAYRGVMENKVTFSSSDLPQGSNTLSLLQAIESFLQSGKSVFYNFLHLSIQEVLSAYYIATQFSDSEQVSQFQQLFNQPRFAAVFQFYAAITKLKGSGILQVIAAIVEAKSKPLLVSLLRCLHEAQDPSLCLYVAERLEYRLDLSKSSLSPLDYLSVSFFLSSVGGKEIFVDLRQSSISDLGVNCLTKYLHSDVDHVSRITIDFCDSEICEEDASQIARLLYFIQHLYLSKNPIGDGGISLISEAIRGTTQLKTLILYKCEISSLGAKDLSRALIKNSSLKVLDIGNNCIGDEGMSHVAEALKRNKYLNELWINYCGITDDGAASLANALSVNNSLKALHMINSGKLTEDGLSMIAESLAHNPKFYKLAINSQSVAFRLRLDANRLRKVNGLQPIEIEGKYYSYTVLCRSCHGRFTKVCFCILLVLCLLLLVISILLASLKVCVFL